MAIYIGNYPAGEQRYTTGLSQGLPRPSVPRHEIERVRGRTHISTYCECEAEKEYAAWMQGEDYDFRMPETDGDGYLLSTSEIGGYLPD